MRGILCRPDKFTSQCGITPAHAGNTSVLFLCVNSKQDHPRACGEYKDCKIVSCHSGGSPPRMRGIRSPNACVKLSLRITPAHAGNTIVYFMVGSSLWDHPRACGEYHLGYFDDHPCKGSPPRMRGIRHMFAEWWNATGITPAHAGNTRCECVRC